MPTIRAYWKLRDFGKCVECRASNPEPEYARCAKCREKRRRAKEAAREAARAALGPTSSYAGRLAAGPI